MTTAVATLDRNLSGTTTTTPAIRELTVEEYGWIAGAHCESDVCVNIDYNGLSAVDWGDAALAAAAGAAGGSWLGLFGAFVGALAGAAASIGSDLFDVHVETGSS